MHIDQFFLKFKARSIQKRKKVGKREERREKRKGKKKKGRNHGNIIGITSDEDKRMCTKAKMLVEGG